MPKPLPWGLIEPDRYYAQSLLHGELAGVQLVQFLGRPHAERAEDAATVDGGDEARAFQRALERRLERAVERRIAGLVLEVGDQHRNGVVLHGRRHRAPRHDVRAGEQGDHEHRGRGHQTFRQAARDGDHLAVLVEAVQRREELGCRLVSALGLRVEATRNQLVQRTRNVGNERSDGRGDVQHATLQVRNGVVSRLGACASDEHVVEDQAERVNVGPLIDRLTQRLLGRHVLDGSNNCAYRRPIEMKGAEPRGDRRPGCPPCIGDVVGQPRDAEIHDQRLSFGVDHDVRRLQITMNDAFRMRRHEARHDVARDLERSRDGKPSVSPHDRREIGALDVRHRDVLDAVDLAEIMNAHDILVRDLSREQQFPFEAPLHFGRGFKIAGGSRQHDLDRHRDAKLGIPGLIDRPHATLPEQSDDVVAVAECFARLQRTAVR